MAGRGPAPKPAHKRARANADPVPQTIIALEPSAQPPLPATRPNGDPWPERTVTWWRLWGESKLAENMTSTDWSSLLDAALLHARIWGEGELKWLGELRLREGKMGATPEDRARLRISFAEADEKDAKRPPTTQSRERWADLHILPSGKSEAG